MKVIINADDFGINPIVTQAIEQCIEKKIVTSTTIMANGECLEEAKRFADLHPEISFGVHLCISEFRSLTKSDVFTKYGITDKDGNFIKKAIFGIKHFSPELKFAVRYELLTQIKKLQDMGFKISHADSHHHAHTIPELVDVFIEVLQEVGITKMRLKKKMKFRSIIRHPALYVKHRRCQRTIKANFNTVNNFSSVMEFSEHPYNCLTAELMCHPGHPASIYVKEMELVKRSAWNINSRCELISYIEL